MIDTRYAKILVLLFATPVFAQSTPSIAQFIGLQKSSGQAAALTAVEPSHVLPTATTGLSIQDFIRQQRSQDQARQAVLAAKWTAFLRGQTPAPSNDDADAYAALNATRAYLESTGGLKARLAIASEQNTYLGFQLSRPTDELTRKAGFDRARRSIFMDVGALSANEWLVIFIHEVSHSLDSELIAAMPVFNDLDKMKLFDQWGKAGRTLDSLNSNEKRMLAEWLLAGLNRGFLAEYRAWLVTFVIYEEGRADGTLQPIDWLEQLRSQIPTGASPSDFIFHYLSPAWTDPTDGVFQYPYMQQELKLLRAKLEQNPSLVKLGTLGTVIGLK